MERCIYNNEGKICGRADIFDLDTGEVWELKTVRTGAAAADAQMDKYVGNYLRESDIPITRGSSGMFPGRFAGSFPLSCMDDNYTVVYFTPQPGVILYTIKKAKEEATQPYAAYVPTPQVTPEKRSTIGGVPQYGYGGATTFVAAVVAVGMMCGGGGGYCFDLSGMGLSLVA